MNGPQKTNPSDLASPLEVLKIAHELREYHHNALWEEEKHFMWINSIILAAQAAVLIKTATEVPSRSLLLAALAAIGLVLAVIALRVIRREGINFVNAHGTFVQHHNLVFSNRKLPAPVGEPNKCICLLPLLLFSKDFSIRDAFQFVLLVFAVVNAILLIGVLRDLV